MIRWSEQRGSYRVTVSKLGTVATALAVNGAVVALLASGYVSAHLDIARRPRGMDESYIPSLCSGIPTARLPCREILEISVSCAEISW